MRLLVAVTCSVALLAACSSGSDDVSSGSTTPATATTSTAGPVSTTTTLAVTTSAPSTVATTPATQSTPPETDAATTVAETEPPTTEAPSTSAAASDTSAATESSAPALAGQYAEVAPPSIPDVSAQVTSAATQADGVYYATVTESGDPPPAAGEVVFELVQLFRGDACTQHFAGEEDACINDYDVETDPTATLAVPLTGDVYVTVADALTQKSLEITGTELYSLLHGDDPSAGAPEDYTYVGFGYVLTISGGRVTKLEQWWTP
jgi:hypothetical protein